MRSSSIGGVCSRRWLRRRRSATFRFGIGLPLIAAEGGSGGVQGAWNGKLQGLGGGGPIGNVGFSRKSHRCRLRWIVD